MTQTFYTKWQSSVLADAGNYVSKEYNNFQTALLSEISKYAKAVDAAVVAESKGHYLTSCFIERNGKFVYISHSSDARMDGGVKIELDSFLIRTARHVKDYTGGINQYLISLHTYHSGNILLFCNHLQESLFPFHNVCKELFLLSANGAIFH